jgi:hypothetical protein
LAIIRGPKAVAAGSARFERTSRTAPGEISSVLAASFVVVLAGRAGGLVFVSERGAKPWT